MLTAHGVTDPGRVRKINEDSLLIDLDLGVFLVADGMGGHNAGEVASQLAVDAIKGFLSRSRDSDDVTWPYGIDPKLSFNANRLMTAIRLANRRVFKAAESRDEYTGMGTTVVAALIERDRLVYAGVGDSRVYIHSSGTLTQLTKDHSWVATIRAEQGQLDEKALADHPLRHVLTNVIGAREQVDVEVGERRVVAGDTLLLSSDGLHGALQSTKIAEHLSSTDPVEQVAKGLVQSGSDADGSDNITVIVIRAT